MDAAAFRARFPVTSRVAYLNAGTCGPMPEVVLAAAQEAISDGVERGRWLPYLQVRVEIMFELRSLFATVLGAREEDVAVTTSTTEGLGKVLLGMGLRAGDEVLTSDEEHPGLIGPLLTLKARGVAIRLAPLGKLHEHITSSTTAVACSHVGWVSGILAPPELRDCGMPVIFDGAQGAGAIPLDMAELGCAAYAGAGQKWLCGADGTGMLYLEPAFRRRLANPTPGYFNLEDPGAGFDAVVKDSAAAFDAVALSRESAAISLASTRLLFETGLQDLHDRARWLSARLVEMLRDAGRTVAPRGDTTLVGWDEPDAEAARDRLNEAGIIVRNMPRRNVLRASVGAWNDESDLERLLAAL